jgi:predicted AlkP superfamily phosphohydrolase/phosphomutase
MLEPGKVVIIGLDGATLDILRPLVEAGVMPTVGRFLQEGAWGNLMSTRPPVTCPAWPSMYTGVGPGKHGVFSFSHRDAATGRVRTAAVTDVHAPKLWELAGEAGLRSAVLNVPITFPAQPLQGVTLSGFVSPDDSKLVSYPQELADEVREALGELKLNWLVLGHRPADVERRNEHVRKINSLMELRIRQFEYVLERSPGDLCFLVHEYTDRVYHLFHHILDPAFPAHHDARNAKTLELLRSGHRRLDESIGRLIDRFGPAANYLIVSDHGFGGVTWWVYVNNLLARCGLTRFHNVRLWTELASRRLRLSSRARRWLGVEPKELWHRQDPACAPLIDFARSQAFAGPQLEHSVYVNVKGRYAAGTVEPGDYHRIRGEIVAALSQATDPRTGARIFEGVWTRDELYDGPFVEQGPDVIYELAPGYMVSNSILPGWASGGGFLRPLKAGWDISGYHRPAGVFLGLGPAFARAGGLEASILDVAPTVLGLLNIAIPESIEGRIMEAALKPGWLNGRAQRAQVAAAAVKPEHPVPYSEAEQREVTRRLEELGYL